MEPSKIFSIDTNLFNLECIYGQYSVLALVPGQTKQATKSMLHIWSDFQQRLAMQMKLQCKTKFD